MIPRVPGGFSREYVGPPIRFYHRHQEYYEYVAAQHLPQTSTKFCRFTNFADYAVRYKGRRYPTGEHRKWVLQHPDRA